MNNRNRNPESELNDTAGMLNAEDKNGHTALMLASHGGHTAVIEILIAKGTKVNAAN